MNKKMLGLGLATVLALLFLPVSLAQVYYSDGNYYTYTGGNSLVSDSYPYSMSQASRERSAQRSGQTYLSYNAQTGRYTSYSGPYQTYDNVYGTYGTNGYGVNGIGTANNPYQTTQYTSEEMAPTKSNQYSDTYNRLNMVNNQHTVNQITPVNRVHQETTYRTTQTSSTQMMPGRTESVETNS